MKFRVSALAGFLGLPALLVTAPSFAAEPTVISADGGALTKQLPGGAVLHLAAGTHLETLRVMKLQLGPPGSAETPTQVLKLLNGRVDVDLPLAKVPKTAVLFQAPHKASAVAKGGHSIAIADADRVTFAAIDGDMLAASGNDWKTLPKGTVRSFVGNDPTPQEHAVPNAPTLGIPRAFVLAPTAGSQDVNVIVGSVPAAEKYELSIWRLNDKSRELVRRQEVQPALNPLRDLPPGHYELSARALDASGVFGKDGPSRSLRIVGAELPPGARYENGSILLSQRGRVKLLGAEGLEAAYGASAHFVRAPGSVGLSRGEAAVVHLREPGTTDELTLSLEPRALHAEVSITPKSAHWPHDKLDVSVRLYDARGRAVSANVPAKAVVLIDVQPVEVTWSRVGNVLSTQVPAAPGQGPWVVRVEVSDEFGDPAGRDFLEIAGDSDRVSSR